MNNASNAYSLLYNIMALIAICKTFPANGVFPVTAEVFPLKRFTVYSSTSFIKSSL